MTSFARRLALAVVVVAALGCRGAVTPRPAIHVVMVGDDAAAEGVITAFALEDGRTAMTGDLGSGGDWGATIRSGSCTEPGTIEHIVGPIENGELNAVVDRPLADLAGKIIVMTRLGTDTISSCGVLGAGLR